MVPLPWSQIGSWLKTGGRWSGLALINAVPVVLVTIGVSRAWAWQEVHSAQAYSFEYDYLYDANVFLALGCLGLAATVYTCCRPAASHWWLLVPIPVSLYPIIGWPLTHFSHLLVSTHPFVAPAKFTAADLSKRLCFIGSDLARWGEKEGRFPRDRSELESAVYLSGFSHYRHQGAPLPYGLTYVADSTGPYVPEEAPREPAHVFVAVNRELDQAWVTATVLDQDTASHASWLARGRGPIAIEVEARDRFAIRRRTIQAERVKTPRQFAKTCGVPAKPSGVG